MLTLPLPTRVLTRDLDLATALWTGEGDRHVSRLSPARLGLPLANLEQVGLLDADLEQIFTSILKLEDSALEELFELIPEHVALVLD